MSMEHLMLCKRIGEEALYDAYRIDEKIQVYPQGGGFLVDSFASADQFNAEFKLAHPQNEFKSGTVTADFLQEVGPIDCYSDGKHWNGWGIPAFDEEAALKLVEIFQKAAVEAGNDTPSSLRMVDGELQEFDSNEEAYQPVRSITQEIDGHALKLWLIGDGWCWDAVEMKAVIPAKRPSI